MGLSSTLATAMSGLRANQAALSIVSSNIANAQTPGYVDQSVNQIEIASGGIGSGVQVIGVNRQLDLYVQNQLRTEKSGAAYADQISNILGRLQNVYGTPGGAGTLETSFNNFTTALQALSTSSARASHTRQGCALSQRDCAWFHAARARAGIQEKQTMGDASVADIANRKARSCSARTLPRCYVPGNRRAAAVRVVSDQPCHERFSAG